MVGWFDPGQLIQTGLKTVFDAFAGNPGLALWVIGVAGLFVLFTDTHSRLHRWIGGLAHATAHWVAVFYIAWAAQFAAIALFPTPGIGRFALSGAIVFAGGWLIGASIVGVYLLVSLNVFGRHSEEAFSALKVQDYKHFLRMHIGVDGALTIYPIKIDRVPRRWRDRRAGEATPSRVVPDEPLSPELIEAPIRTSKSSGSTACWVGV